LKSNLKGKIQQLQSSWGSMLGMSLFIGSVLLSGSQKESTSVMKRAFFILRRQELVSVSQGN
jgi:hypothetical protein